MDCENVHQHAVEYFEGRLTPDAQRGIEEHCASCPECAQMIVDCSAIVSSLGNLQVKHMPHSVVDRICRNIDVVAARQKHSWFFPALKIVVPVAVLVLAMLVILDKRTRSPLNVTPKVDVVIAGSVENTPHAAQDLDVSVVAIPAITDVRTIEMAIITAAYGCFADENGVWRGASSETNAEVKRVVDVEFSNHTLRAIPLNEEMKQIIYRRAQRVPTLSLLKQRHLIVEGDGGVIVMAHPGRPLPASDAINVSDENADREHLFQLYAQSLSEKSGRAREIKHILRRAAGKILSHKTIQSR